MSKWVRRMKEVDGWEPRFTTYLRTLSPQPSQFRIQRLALKLRRHHIVIGRGMYALLNEHDRLNYGSSVRREMLKHYD
jgi:hypothetical protein